MMKPKCYVTSRVHITMNPETATALSSLLKRWATIRIGDLPEPLRNLGPNTNLVNLGDILRLQLIAAQFFTDDSPMGK